MSKSRTDQNDQTKDGWLHTLHTLHNQNHHRAELKSIDDFWANCTNWRHFSSFTVVQWHSFTTLFILAFLPYLIDTFLWSLFFPLPISLPHYPLPRPPPQPHLSTHTHTLNHRPSVFLHTHKDAQRWAGAHWGRPAHPAGLLRGQPGPGSFPGCRVEAQTTSPLSTLLLHRVVCPHCFHADGEKNGQLEKCRRRRGIQMQPAPRSFYLDQYCPASGGSAHKAEGAGGLLHSTVIHLGCCGVWQVNKFFFFSHDLRKKGYFFQKRSNKYCTCGFGPKATATI